MRILTFIVIVIVLSFFNQTSVFSQGNSTTRSHISVTGTAFDAKAGAVVVDEKGQTYYIENLSSWPDNFINKHVAVTGTLHKETFRQEDLKNDKGEWSQGMAGEKFTIIKPKWEIIVKQKK